MIVIKSQKTQKGPLNRPHIVESALCCRIVDQDIKNGVVADCCFCCAPHWTHDRSILLNDSLDPFNLCEDHESWSFRKESINLIYDVWNNRWASCLEREEEGITEKKTYDGTADCLDSSKTRRKRPSIMLAPTAVAKWFLFVCAFILWRHHIVATNGE